VVNAITNAMPSNRKGNTMKIFQTAKPMPKPNGDPMTRDTIAAIIQSVDLDPLAGLGHLTKREILIDRLLAHCRTVQPEVGVKVADALLSEPELNLRDAAA